MTTPNSNYMRLIEGGKPKEAAIELVSENLGDCLARSHMVGVDCWTKGERTLAIMNLMTMGRV